MQLIIFTYVWLLRFTLIFAMLQQLSLNYYPDEHVINRVCREGKAPSTQTERHLVNIWQMSPVCKAFSCYLWRISPVSPGRMRRKNPSEPCLKPPLLMLVISAMPEHNSGWMKLSSSTKPFWFDQVSAGQKDCSLCGDRYKNKKRSQGRPWKGAFCRPQKDSRNLLDSKGRRSRVLPKL